MTARRLSVVGLVLAAMLADVPAWAQSPLSGNWLPMRQHEDDRDRGPGPDLGDYTGLPINDAARLFAESWDASRLTLQEHQCRVHVAPYIYHGPLNLRIWEEKDPKTQQVVALKNYVSTYEQTRTIWLDGRPHPSPFAPHTFMGFSTGKWDGRVLTVVTTHLKQGWLRRNGVPESDQTTLFEHFSRHGNYLTHTVIITDPVYLAEPMIRTTDFQLSERDVANWQWPCEYVEEISGRAKGEVPHYLPGTNPYLQEFVQSTGVPAASVHGGAATIYPEYQARLKQPGLDASTTPASRTSQAKNPDRGTIEVLPVQGNVYLLAGGGGNAVLHVGESGAILVDTKAGMLTEQVLAEVRKLTPAGKTLRIIMNTSADADHVGGNQKIAEALGSSAAWTIINTPGGSNAAVKIVSHDNVLPRVSHLKNTAWPTETYIEADREFHFNGEPVSMRHVAAAHSDGDSIVIFRKSDVVATGDIYRTDGYPVIDLERGGSVQGVLNGLNLVLDIAIPEHHEEGGTLIVPGHGRISDEFDLVEYRDMVAIVKDRIQAMIKKGMTLDQVKAARPTLDYDPRYGATTGPWTTDQFVEAVFKSLTAPRPTSTQ